MDQESKDAGVGGPRVRWADGSATAYLAALWGSLIVILATVGNMPTLDATRPGNALVALALVVAGASFLGGGAAGVSGALAGAASAYALAIITTMRAAEVNTAFIATGPAPAWQAGVTDALLRSLLLLGAAALISALARGLAERRPQRRPTPRPPWRVSDLVGPVIIVLIGAAALGGTSALVGAAASSSIVLPTQVPTVTATGQGALVTVAPATLAPGEVFILTDSRSPDACVHCFSGGFDFFGPLSDAELAILRIDSPIDEWVNRLPRPASLWYGGLLLTEGLYAFAHTAYYEGSDKQPRLIGVGLLMVSAGPTPVVALPTPGSAPVFVGVERLVLTLHGAAVGFVLFRRRRIADLAGPRRWLTTIGLAAVLSLLLAAGLAFYVGFAGSPF